MCRLYSGSEWNHAAHCGPCSVSTFFFCSCKAKRSAGGWEPGSCPIDEAQLAHVDQLRHGGATGANREAISRLEAAQNASPRHISRALHTHHPAQGCARAIRMVLAESWLPAVATAPSLSAAGTDSSCSGRCSFGSSTPSALATAPSAAPCGCGGSYARPAGSLLILNQFSSYIRGAINFNREGDERGAGHPGGRCCEAK